MSNDIERGTSQGEGLTRREALSKITGLAATALVLAGGCVEVDPQRTVPEPQTDEEAARNTLALSTAAILAALLLLRGIK